MKLIDLHCDTVLRLFEEKKALAANDCGVDLQKLKQADSLAQFFALFVDLETVADPLAHCLAMLDCFANELEKNKSLIAPACNYDDLLRNQEAGKLSAFLSIEEGGVLKGEMSSLRNFYRLGVRMITLTWNHPNELGFPNSGGIHSAKGLTDFGRETICEMNRLGMLIDVSHLSDQGFYDVAALSKQPFVASHSNARSVTGHPRNLSDEMIGLLAEKGGVTGITFPRQFLGIKEISLVEDIIIHLKHIKNKGGSEVLAIGTDLDGTKPPLEIDNIAAIDKLFHALQKNGFKADEIEKIFYRNALRVIKEVLR